MYIETDQIELKQRYTNDIAKEVIAFLNTCGGTIYIGINDDGEVVGVDDQDETLLKVSNLIHDTVVPDALSFIHIDIYDDSIIRIQIMEGTNKPYYIKRKGLRPEGVYVRIGTSSRPSTETGIKQMLMSSYTISYEEQLSKNQDLTFETMNEVFSSNKLALKREQMKSFKLVNMSGNYTNLAYLLSDQCMHSLKVAVYKGTSEYEFQNRREFGGSLFKILKDTLEYIEVNNNLTSQIEGYRRIDTRDYKPEVIREAVVNAIIHRDYSYSGSILINLHENRMEITSLGGLDYGLTYKDLSMGISQTRNPNLAQIFYRLRFVEAYGTGLKKIQYEYSDYDFFKLVKLSDHVFKVILWNKNLASSIVKESEDDYFTKQIDPSINEFLKQRSNFTRLELQEYLQVGQTKAGLIIKELLNNITISKTGKGKAIKYLIK